MLSKRLDKYPLLLVSFGLFLFFLGASRWWQLRVLSFAQVPAAVATGGEIPNQIIIPSLKIDIPVDEAEIKEGIWQISYKNATFLKTSARPGMGGNIVIYGHNKKAIFGSLPYLALGQKVILKTREGKTYEYEVYRKEFVAPSRVDLVSPTDHEELTLFTCWGLFDGRRVVVKARPV